MITNAKEKEFPAAKPEGPSDERLYKASTSSSRQWSSAGFRNPRIVRVSRTFGGKDRHSKVCTVRGLRDRRIRLSVPTAVQLYDLQDRLGLGQPSKVIDWLIDATKEDIDKLPPLQIPQGALGQFLHHHHHDLHQHLNLLPHHDHHQAKTNEQDQFAQKLFGNMSSSYLNYYQNSDQTSFLGHGIALPQIDGSHSNLVMSNSSTSSFNLPSLQSSLFFCAPPPPSNISAMSSLFGNPYPPYISSTHYENPHDPIRSQIINSHIQLLSASSTSTSTSANTSASSSSSSSQQYQHVLNNSLMSSLHSTSTTTSTSANINNNPPLIKSFPALFNPRLLAQSSSTVYKSQLEKDRSTAD